MMRKLKNSGKILNEKKKKKKFGHIPELNNRVLFEPLIPEITPVYPDRHAYSRSSCMVARYPEMPLNRSDAAVTATTSGFTDSIGTKVYQLPVEGQ